MSEYGVKTEHRVVAGVEQVEEKHSFCRCRGAGIGGTHSVLGVQSGKVLVKCRDVLLFLVAKSQIEQQAGRIIAVVRICLCCLFQFAERTGINCLVIGALLGSGMFLIHCKFICHEHIKVILAVICHATVHLDAAEDIVHRQEWHQDIILIGNDRHVVLFQRDRQGDRIRLCGLVLRGRRDHAEFHFFNDGAVNKVKRSEPCRVVDRDRIRSRIDRRFRSVHGYLHDLAIYSHLLLALTEEIHKIGYPHKGNILIPFHSVGGDRVVFSERQLPVHMAVIPCDRDILGGDLFARCHINSLGRRPFRSFCLLSGSFRVLFRAFSGLRILFGGFRLRLCCWRFGSARSPCGASAAYYSCGRNDQ